MFTSIKSGFSCFKMALRNGVKSLLRYWVLVVFSLLLTVSLGVFARFVLDPLAHFNHVIAFSTRLVLNHLFFSIAIVNFFYLALRFGSDDTYSLRRGLSAGFNKSIALRVTVLSVVLSFVSYAIFFGGMMMPAFMARSSSNGILELLMSLSMPLSFCAFFVLGHRWFFACLGLIDQKLTIKKSLAHAKAISKHLGLVQLLTMLTIGILMIIPFGYAIQNYQVSYPIFTGLMLSCLWFFVMTFVQAYKDATESLAQKEKEGSASVA